METLPVNGHRRRIAAASNGTSDQPYPKNLDAERAVIGSAILDPACIGAIVNILSPGDFFLPVHREIYKVLLQMHFSGEPIGDLTLLCERLGQERLEEFGGKAYLVELVEPSTPRNHAHYAKIVATRAGQRRLIDVGQAIIRMGNDAARADLSVLQAEAVAAVVSAAKSNDLTHECEQAPAAWQPFPVDVLPVTMRNYVVAQAQSIDCDVSMVALPSLSVAASAIGNTRRAGIKSSWSEPSVVWTGIIARVGSAKSAAFTAALKPVHQYQGELAQKFELGKPSQRIYLGDATIEAACGIIGESPRGLLVARDELAAWIQSMQRYQTSGSDSGQWLELHAGQPLVVDRRQKDRLPVRVQYPAVSVTGAIQPEVLRRCLGSEHLEDGLAQRLLMAMPPTWAQRFTEVSVSDDVYRAWRSTLDGLWQLESCRTDAGPFPRTVNFSQAAKRNWITWHDHQRVRQDATEGPLRGALAKMPGACARIALILQLASAAEGAEANADEIGAGAIAGAIRIVEWCAAEAKRVYAMLDATAQEQAYKELIDFIRRKGGRVAARDLQGGLRKYRSPGSAFGALSKLVAQGVGQWESRPAPKGAGRHAEPVFALVDAPAPTKLPGAAE